MNDRRPSETHSARPTDLVALVTFDDEVYENHAVTLDRLARPNDSPRPLAAAMEQWLGLGRQLWVDVRGREIVGIATARELSDRAWIIETLIDASGADGDPDEVFVALLRRAADGAGRHGVTHILVRTRLHGPAREPAMHAGFKQVGVEELWQGPLEAAPASGERYPTRVALDSDDFGRFQLFNHLLPLDAREAMAMTLEEWQATRERRWLGRGGLEFVALDEDRIVGTLGIAAGKTPQCEFLVDPQHPGAAASLAAEAARMLVSSRRTSPLLALAPAGNPSGALLQEMGLQAVADYALLCLRIVKPLRVRRRVAAGMAVPTRG